jgi:hypothetical protein
MTLLNVYNALYTQLKANTTLIDYVDDSQFLRGFKEPMPQQQYTVVLEPGEENEDHESQSTKKVKEVTHYIDIYTRVIFFRGIEYSIIGNTTDGIKGLLEFTEDVKNAIRADMKLSYNRVGSSVSSANAGTSFDLLSSAKNLTVTINEKTPSGYDAIECGSSTLTGTQIAANIQTALRALGRHDDDGFYKATCTFSDSTKKFTISSAVKYGPKSIVTVTAGASNDCSTLLGFDSPTEVVGRNITSVKFGTVRADNSAYPVRYRVIPVLIREEILT